MLISGMSRSDSLQIFMAGIEAVKPSHFIPAQIKLNKNVLTVAEQSFLLTDINHLYIISVGKAAAAMAEEAEKILGKYIYKGFVVTKYQHTLPLQYCKIIEAGHPVPDANSIAGGETVVELLREAKQNDLIIFLISGGASALLSDHPPGCTLHDIQQTAQLLLDSGAAIDEINTIRKHLSLIKGGQLMKYTSAPVMSLILSDVPGDDISIIASGLTVPDKTTFTDSWDILLRYRLTEKLPEPVKAWIQKGVAGQIADTPKQGDPVFNKVHNILVATNKTALNAAAAKAVSLGYNTHIISPTLSGEAAEQAIVFTTKLKNTGNIKPSCLLWGGETTVTIKGDGKGGRNQEFALSALCVCKNDKWFMDNNTIILAGGTDGTDGPTDATGAVVDADIITTMNQLAIDPVPYLRNNDAYRFFEKTNGLIITGPTQTNVMDIVVGLI